ncbi:MAG: site-specific DNA-methyltransferase [Planctomycetes bacterium]|nr:site-specific DNA-methyltransferase [Planctomycetota bacterium]
MSIEQQCTCRRCGQHYTAPVESRHRLLCGDARNAGDMARLTDGRSADMVWTDPPYGVAIASRVGTTSGMSSSQARAEGHAGIANDDLDVPQLVTFLRGAFETALDACKPGAVWYVAAPHGPMGVAFSMVLHDLDIWHSSLVWVKDSMVISRLDYHYRHEVLYYDWKPGGAHHPVPDRCQTSVFEFPRPKRSEEHPTMKPVELIRKHIENSRDPGQTVLDSFAGSGSTLIAAEQTGRNALLMELDPRFCDVVVKRWEAFTGRKAERVLAEQPQVEVSC